MTVTIDRPLFAAICLGLLAVMFLVGVYGWFRAAAQADRDAFDQEREF